MAYIKDHVTAPSVLDVKTRQRLMGAPWLLRVVCRLCREGFGTAEQVWNMPVGKAMWYSATCDELEGGVSLGDEDYEKFLKEAHING